MIEEQGFDPKHAEHEDVFFNVVASKGLRPDARHDDPDSDSLDLDAMLNKFFPSDETSETGDADRVNFNLIMQDAPQRTGEPEAVYLDKLRQFLQDVGMDRSRNVSVGIRRFIATSLEAIAKKQEAVFHESQSRMRNNVDSTAAQMSRMRDKWNSNLDTLTSTLSYDQNFAKFKATPEGEKILLQIEKELKEAADKRNKTVTPQDFASKFREWATSPAAASVAKRNDSLARYQRQTRYAQ